MIVALGHRKRVGKDTIAKMMKDHLVEMGQTDVRIVSFASKLKEIAHNLYGWAGLRDEQFYEDHSIYREYALPKIGKTPRQIWIELGNKVRDIYEDTWVDIVLESRVGGEVVIIKDLRYPNEAKRIKSLSGRLVKISNKNIPDTNDVADSALRYYRYWDYIIHNDSTLEHLDVKAKELCSVIMDRKVK